MKKQKIIIFGNCITFPIYKILQTNSEFNQKYDIELLKHCFLCNQDDTLIVQEAVKNCDILITQPISSKQYVKLGLDTNTLKACLSKNARLIKIPVPYFTGYNPEQFYLRNKSGAHIGVCEGLLHPYHNKLIFFGYINNATPEETLNFLNSDNNIKNINKIIQENLDELKQREQYTDFKISDFIEKNYKDVRLFWTENHPTNTLLEYMSKEILKLLDIDDNIKCEENFLNEIQTPILDSVKKELKFNFNDENIVTIEEIENYYKYYDNNKDLVEINKNIVIEFCKGIKIDKKTKKYLLFGFLPIYQTKKYYKGHKKYVLGIPYASFQDNGEEIVKRNFFQMLKKKKTSMYSKYYFFGIQIWCKKKSKINVLMDKFLDLQSQIQDLKGENTSLKSELQHLRIEHNNLIYTLKDELEIYKLKDNKQHSETSDKTNTDINICMITDENYVRPTLVAMFSAIYNKNSNSKYNFYLILNNVSENNIRKFKQLEHDDIKINIINADVSKYNNVIVHTHVSPSACLKFDLADILNLDKVLYLDSDILVRKDLSELYSKDVSNYYLGAIRDMGAEINQHFNSIIGIDKYFNSGVLLLNLAKIREEHLSEQFIKIKLTHSHWKCMDQDTLNYVMSKNTLWLDVKYNCMLPLYNNPFYDYTIARLNEFYQTEYVNKLEMEYASVIVHFAGEAQTRPWNCKNGTYQKIWNYFDSLIQNE